MEEKTNIEKLVDFNTLDNVATFVLDYDGEMDSLMLQSVEGEAGYLLIGTGNSGLGLILITIRL